jgi:hypothetical protein
MAQFDPRDRAVTFLVTPFKPRLRGDRPVNDSPNFGIL